MRHKAALAAKCEACGAGSGVPCSTYAAQMGVMGWGRTDDSPFFGVDRSPAAQLQALRLMDEAGFFDVRPSRWYRARRGLVRFALRLLRVDAEDL